MTRYIFFLFCFLFSCTKNDYTTPLGGVYLELCGDFELNKSNFSVLSFNRLEGTSLTSVSNVIEKLNPDIIGLQESYDVGIQIADRFGFCFYGDENKSVAMLSKFPLEIVDDIQCKVMFNDDFYLHFFNVHLPSSPYQPYDIRDTLITTQAQAVHQAEQTRGTEVTELVSSVENIITNMPIMVVGDFNEPSHLDWILDTENPLQFQFNNPVEQFVVNWPSSNKVEEIGLVDVYRFFFPDPLEDPGYTWTPNYTVGEVHDRIDFIYYNDKLVPESVDLIGPDNNMSDIVISDYESDHRAVFSTFSLDLNLD